MATLPPSTDITSSAATEGQAKAWLAGVRTFIAQQLGADGTQLESLQALGAPFNGAISKVGVYTVVEADRGKVIRCSGTWTLSVTAAATLGDGFCFVVANEGAGTITVDPSLSETINNQTTKMVGPGDSLIIYCDGTKFFTAGGGSAGGGGQLFTSSGIFTVPAGVTAVKVTALGGGGGGGAARFSSDYGYGGPGGPGAHGIDYVTGLTPGGTVTVTVGSGGAAGAAGGASSFGSYITAGGGGAGGNGDSVTGVAGAIGALTGATLSMSGGQAQIYNSINNPFGSVGYSYSSGRYAGLAGTGYGAGGGGGSNESNTSWCYGGAGSGGFVLVEW